MFMYDITGYYEAKSTAEAISLLQEHPQARIICGGSDVLIKIREGKLAGAELVSIRNIPEFYGVCLDEKKNIRIGAATTFSHITSDPLIRQYIPVLGEAVDMVGGPQVRNIGTIGGNICNGAVSADSAATVFSLEAQLEIVSAKGNRTVSVEDFYLGPGKVDLRQGEIVTHIIIPRENYEGYHGNYIKYSMRNAMDIATLSCSVVSRLSADQRVLEDVRITFGVAAPVPCRCRETEALLKGMDVGEELYQAVEDSVRREINPRDSWRASKAFRLQIAGEIARRALQRTIELAGGEKHE